MHDPTPFLSTLIATSATLVGIVGGLLVARFVSLDSDQKGAAALLEDATERRKAARLRTEEARTQLLDWYAADFFTTRKVIESIVNGTEELDKVYRIEDCELSRDELQPYLNEVLEQIQLARDAINPEHVPMLDESDAYDSTFKWDQAKYDIPGFESSPWPAYWEEIYRKLAESVVLERAEEEEAEREAARQGQEAGLTNIFGGGALAGILKAQTAMGYMRPAQVNLPLATIGPRTDAGVTNARRADELRRDRELAERELAGLEVEVSRLTREQARVVRPDKWLAWGMIVLTYFTAVGVGLPLYVLSKGPTNLTPHIRDELITFGSGLLALIGYMIAYVLNLSKAFRRKRYEQDPNSQ